jgi:glutamate 5-kinase
MNELRPENRPEPRAIDDRSAIRLARRVVVKIGTGVLTAAGGGFDRVRFEALCSGLAKVAASRELVVVSSGAIALGVERLGLKARPKDIPTKQAAAAVGQSRLMRLYDDVLGAQGLIVAQVLLTHADVQSRTRYLNARHALEQLVARRAVPIINENDTVSVEELKFGDNDTLAGMTVDLVGADILVILTDIDGVYTADPRVDPAARKLDVLDGVDDAVLAAGGESRSGVGTGGMASKLKAARRAGESRVPTVIAPGKQDGVLDDVFAGAPVGTFIRAPQGKGTGRQRWIARDLQKKGELRIDDGAVKAVVDHQKSLLPSGVREVRGTFAEGEAVDICDLAGRAVARGLAGYASDDLKRIAGLRSADIEPTLGYKYLDEAVHKDDLVVLDTEVAGGR